MFMSAQAFLKRMNTVPLIVDLKLGKEGGLDFHFILSVVPQFYNKKYIWQRRQFRFQLRFGVPLIPPLKNLNKNSLLGKSKTNTNTLASQPWVILQFHLLSLSSFQNTTLW